MESSSSSAIPTSSGSEEILVNVMEERKRKRKISNRESARKSRMKKQKILDDLTAQVTQLKKENQEIVTSVSITTQHYLTVETENAVLRAQLDELKNRLDSLNDIIEFLGNEKSNVMGSNLLDDLESDEMNMNAFYMNQQPLMASCDALLY